MVDTGLIGVATQPQVLDIERGPITNFARAVKCRSEIYRDADAAAAAGFGSIPAPPTFGYSAAYWAAFEEMQPPKNDTDPVFTVMGGLMATGGMVLHGEQEFTFHKPYGAGSRLTTTGRIRDIAEKLSSSGQTMTSVSIETEFRDESGDLVLTMVVTLLHRGAKP